MKPRMVSTGGLWWIEVGPQGRRYCLGVRGFAEAARVAEWDGATMVVRELEDALLADYDLKGRPPRAIRQAQFVCGALRRYCSEGERLMSIADLGSEHLARFARWRLKDHKPGTVHQDLKIIHRALQVLCDWGRIARVPKMPPVPASPPRTGFLTDAQVDLVVEQLDPVLRPLVRFLSFTGWRKSEALGLKWTAVDFSVGVVRLESAETKSREGREFPFKFLRPLEALLRMQRTEVSRLQALIGKVIPWIFCRRAGGPVVRFDHAWVSACRRAGIPGKHIHDLRRSAVRRFELAGVPRSVGMRLTGHRSERIYRAYATYGPQDLEDGVRRLETYMEQQSAKAVSSQQAGPCPSKG